MTAVSIPPGFPCKGLFSRDFCLPPPATYTTVPGTRPRAGEVSQRRCNATREVWPGFERRLDEMRVPPPQRPGYRKWVRFYFDFCQKYGHSPGAPASRGPSLAKLASKNQSEAQRSQASMAVGLLFQSASEAGAKPASPAAISITRPPGPLNSQSLALCGEGSTALRLGTRE